MRFWKNCRQYTWLWGILTGILFLGIGMADGQLDVIWRKAAMICMECIGLG